MKAEAVFFAVLLLVVLAVPASPAEAAPAKGAAAVSFEPIPGSKLKRVILTAKAAERLGIETTKVSEAPLSRRQMVSGLVVASAGAQKQVETAPLARGFGGFGGGASPKPVVPVLQT